MDIQVGSCLFRVRMIPAILTLLLLILLLSLGFWQLDRADQKRALFVQLEQSNNSEELHLTADSIIDLETLRYRKVLLSGTYDSAHQFLLDNQVFEGKAGYFIMTPLILHGSDKAVLVNRGWVPGNVDRALLPKISVPQRDLRVSGHLNYFPGVGIKLDGAEIPSAGWPSVVQLVNTKVLQKKLGYPLFDFQIQLDKDQPEGYTREWKKTTLMPPEKHIAYAMQWFGLATTLVILVIWISIKKDSNE